jgi:hypothetical protein
MTQKRTLREASVAVESTIREIRGQMKGESTVTDHTLITYQIYNSSHFQNLVKRVCAKYSTDERHIRRVALWEK